MKCEPESTTLVEEREAESSQRYREAGRATGASRLGSRKPKGYRLWKP
jgi:hypothetical protein